MEQEEVKHCGVAIGEEREVVSGKRCRRGE